MVMLLFYGLMLFLSFFLQILYDETKTLLCFAISFINYNCDCFRNCFPHCFWGIKKSNRDILSVVVPFFKYKFWNNLKTLLVIYSLFITVYEKLSVIYHRTKLLDLFIWSLVMLVALDPCFSFTAIYSPLCIQMKSFFNFPLATNCLLNSHWPPVWNVSLFKP